jgi:hypothetical protein
MVAAGFEKLQLEFDNKKAMAMETAARIKRKRMEELPQ